MRVTYLAHACLLVESGGVRLVTDPWLDGPTYLHAWWHFPAPAASGADLAGVDYVYLTHEHVDHFHVPTLDKLPRSTPILIGRYMTDRFRRRLATLGFTDVRELPHGREVPLGDGSLRVTSYQYRADDTALVLRDDEATVLDLNDCLLRAGALAQVLERHPRIDLLAASFANAESYPIRYEFEGAGETADWDDRSRFDGFLDKVRRIQPAAFVPFASMFCFLSDELLEVNDRIVSPAGLIARAEAGEVAARGLPMNPGDVWTPGGGHEVRNVVDWSRKPTILRGYVGAHAAEIASLAAAEVVPGGAVALRERFTTFFQGFARRLPPLVGRKLDLSVLFDVAGPAGGQLWVRFHKGRVDLSPPTSDDAWDVRVMLRDWPLDCVLSGIDTWQTLGISCRFRVRLRPGARAREVIFWSLLYLDDLGYLEPLRLLTPRALGVAGRRRRELLEYARSIVSGRFVESNLRAKFEQPKDS